MLLRKQNLELVVDITNKEQRKGRRIDRIDLLEEQPHSREEAAIFQTPTIPRFIARKREFSALRPLLASFVLLLVQANLLLLRKHQHQHLHTTNNMAPAFTGGSLSFKGDKKKKKSSKKKKKETKHSLKKKDEEAVVPAAAAALDSDMTDAERKALKRRQEREQKELEQVAQKSHRERVEEFNAKLASTTELNDIPRVSAAGNG